LQQRLFKRIYKYIPQNAKLFSFIQYLTELGQNICDRPLASEKDLETYQRLGIKRPITYIISYLEQIKEACYKFNLSGNIIFENYTNTLSDYNKNVQQSLQGLPILSKGQALSLNPKPRNANQICVYKETNSTHSLCIVIEYKPSYKLLVFNLWAGLLRADKGSINIPEDVINWITTPINPKDKFVCYSEWLTTAALTQTYKYMLENGLKYSKLVTREADVFL
jgi:hypothetical protein